jgi:hypothetical protein
MILFQNKLLLKEKFIIIVLINIKIISTLNIGFTSNFKLNKDIRDKNKICFKILKYEFR